jgi:hypothetical protein
MHLGEPEPAADEDQPAEPRYSELNLTPTARGNRAPPIDAALAEDVHRVCATPPASINTPSPPMPRL